jgi:hypothetical protein
MSLIAEVVKLVYTQCSERCARKGVEVQVLSSAPDIYPLEPKFVIKIAPPTTVKPTTAICSSARGT